MRGSSPRMTRSPLDRVPRHDVVRVRPAWQRLQALTPCANCRMILADVEAELFRRKVEVARERNIRDSRPVAEHEFAAPEPLVDVAEIAVEGPLEERKHSRIARGFGEVLQETVWAEKSVDLLIIEDDPA